MCSTAASWRAYLLRARNLLFTAIRQAAETEIINVGFSISKGDTSADVKRFYMNDGITIMLIGKEFD